MLLLKNDVGECIGFLDIIKVLCLDIWFCFLLNRACFGDCQHVVNPLNVYHLKEKDSNEMIFKLAFHDYYLLDLHRDLR